MGAVRSRARKAVGSGAARQELLEVAGSLFDRKGYRGTSIRDIARTTDTSISNIYHYFGSKEGLWKEIQNNTVREIPGQLRAAIAGEGDPALQFKRLLGVHLKLADKFRRESRIFFINADRLDASRDARQREIQREVLAVYLEVLGRMQKRGYLESRRLKIVAFNVLGVINWMLRWYRPDGELSAEEVRKEIIGFVARGVGVPD